jgi:integrase
MGKRAKHEGSVYQRGSDGRWVASLTMPDGRRRSWYGQTQQEALEKKNSAMRRLADGLQIAPERLTIGTWLDRWLVDVAAPSVRPSTLRTYQDAVRLHIRPALGRRRLRDLQPADIRRFELAMIQNGLRPSTVGRIHAALRSALSAAERDGLLARNPGKLVSPPHVARAERHPFTPDEAQRFIESCKGAQLGALFVVCLTAGLREGEALALHWRHVDLERGRLAVQFSLGRGGTLHEPKTVKSRRTLPLLAVAVEALKAHHARQLEERLRAGERWEDNDLVFATLAGKPLGARNVIRTFHRHLDKHGYRHQRIHDLRHACASLLAASGVPLRTVSEILGHSSYQLTADLYEHVYETVTDQAVQRLEALLAAQ